MGALTVSASAVIAVYTAPTTFALGMSSVIFAATGLVLFESTVTIAADDTEGSRRGLTSSNGTPPRRNSVGASQRKQQTAALRDIAAAMIAVCGIAWFAFEPSITSTTISWEPVYRAYHMDWRDVHNYRILLRVLWTIPVHFILNILTFVLVSLHPLPGP